MTFSSEDRLYPWDVPKNSDTDEDGIAEVDDDEEEEIHAAEKEVEPRHSAEPMVQGQKRENEVEVITIDSD